MFSKSNDRRDQGRSPTSLLSHGLTIEGNLSTDGDVQLDGMVRGDVVCKTLTVGLQGAVVGAVTAELVRLRGRVEGRISAAVVELAASAAVAGDIVHESLAIEAGARVDGHVKRRQTNTASYGTYDSLPKPEQAKPQLVSGKV